MTQLLDQLASSPIVGAALLAVAGAAAGLWLAAAWWTYADMARRVRPEIVALAAPAWILASTPVLLPLSLAAYLLVRPQETVAERRGRELLTALAPALLEDEICPSCDAAVDPDWRRCPSCAAWLGAPCSHCGRWSQMTLELCPFCATDRSLPRVIPERRGLRWQQGTSAPSAQPGRAESSVRSMGAPNRRARDPRRAGRAASASGPRLARIGR